MSKKVFYSCLFRSFNALEADPLLTYTNDLKVEVDTDGFDSYEEMLDDITERAIAHQDEFRENDKAESLLTIVSNIKTFRENTLNEL